MTLTLAPFLTVWAILAVNILSPGPNVLNTIITAMGSGRRAGLASAAGVALGIGLWCLAMTLGLATLFRAVPTAQAALTVFAIGLLLWFARRYLRTARCGGRLRGDRLSAEPGLAPHTSFLRSLAVNATNPKALTTWVVILSIFPVAEARAGDIALLGVGAATLAFGVHAGYALAFSTAPAARLWERLAPAISAGVGLFLIAFAAKLLHDLVV